MARSGKLLSVLWVLSLAGTATAGERFRRELRFPKGGSFVAAVALASLLPKGPTDGLAHVLEFDLGFPFPEKFQIGGGKAEKKMWKDRRRGDNMTKSGSNLKRFRGRRNLKEDQRQKLLLHLQDAIDRAGFNGSACVSRLRCDLRHTSPSGSLLEELLHALLPPPSHRQECHRLQHGCPISLLHVLMHSEQISPGDGP